MVNETLNCKDGATFPSYTLQPAPPLLSFISDVSLSLWLPFIVYWAISAAIVVIESTGLGARLQPFNTPTEMLLRNRVSKTYAFFYILMNFAIQGTIAWALSRLGDEEFVGREEYDIAVWAWKIHSAQRWVPRLLGTAGINSRKLATNLAGRIPNAAAVLAGGDLLSSSESASGIICPELKNWEISFAGFVYYYLIPALQFLIAFNITDAWQYFGHRLLHEWKWLYRKS